MMSRTVRRAFSIRASMVLPWLVLSVFGVAQPGYASAAAFAQEAAAQTQSAAPKMLQIVILEGEDALNNVRDRTAREPIVEVQDENHKPVAGVLVLFTIHSGAGGAGALAGGATSLSVTTGANGQAILQGFQVNQVAGSYTIQVQAKLGDLTAQNTIHESNATSSAPPDTAPPETLPQQTAPPETAPQQAVPQPTSAVTRVPGIRHGRYLVGAAVAGLVVAIVFGVHTHSTSISAGAGTVHP